MNDQHFINKIKKVAKEVIPSGGQLFIYGSRARGDANEGSDWDLLIILDKSKIEQSDYDNVSFSYYIPRRNGRIVPFCHSTRMLRKIKYYCNESQ